MFASWFNHRNIWIVIGHLCASFCQQLHQRITGRLALIIDVRLIGQTQNQNLGAVDGLASRVERICNRADNMLGHARIDLAGQLNETRMLTIFASLPGEIKWIDGDAMPAKPRAGIKRHETKWLRLGGFDDLPDVNSHGAVHDFQLINQRDIYAAENVLQKLARLSHATRRNGHHFVDRFTIKHHGPLKARRSITAHHLRN